MLADSTIWARVSSSSSSSSSSAGHPLARVAVGAAMISTAAVFVKWAAAAGVGESAIGAWRCLFGAVVLFPLASMAGAPLVPPKKVLRVAAFGGLCFAVDLFVWHRSIVVVGAGMATILANTQVFWTTGLARLLYRAPIRTAFVFAAFVAFVGVVLLVGLGSDVAFTPTYSRGVAFGLMTGLAYAGYVLSIQRAAVLQAADPKMRVLPSIARSMSILAWASLVTGTLLAIAAAALGERLVPSEPQAWWTLVGLALVPQVLGWIAITGGLQRVAAARGALVLLIQPILATVWGVVLFAETLSVVQIVGAAMTLAAVYWGARTKE